MYMVLPFKVWDDFSPKKASDMEETKTFLGKNVMGRLLFLIGGLIIRCAKVWEEFHKW